MVKPYSSARPSNRMDNPPRDRCTASGVETVESFRFWKHPEKVHMGSHLTGQSAPKEISGSYLSFCASRFKLVVAGGRKLRVSISCHFRSQTSLLALLVMAPYPVVKPKRNFRNMVPESAGSPRWKLKISAAGSHLETCTAAGLTPAKLLRRFEKPHPAADFDEGSLTVPNRYRAK